jgi:UDP-glucose 4-epimerase
MLRRILAAVKLQPGVPPRTEPLDKIIIPVFRGGRPSVQKRVLVTGGAGFIGSELVRQLAARDCHVQVVDNLVNGRRENLDGILGGSVELTVGDIRDQKAMESLLRGVDIVFHLACLGVRHSIHSPIENHEVNASATLGLLKLAKDGGVQRFVYVSSSEVYGTARTAPITEEHPTLPMTVYGASKLAGESYTRAFWETYRYPTTVVRPFNAYGPRCHHEGDSGEVIPKFMLRCMAGKPMVIFGDGTQTRDFTFVSDTAAGIIAAGFTDASVGQTINLGSGKEIQIAELAKTVANVIGRTGASITHVESRPGDVLRLLADSSKAERLLNFKPTIGLRDGLSKLRDWYLGQGKSAEELLENEVVRNWEPRDVPTHA